jgi:ribosome-binding protein aMBF1 (putative translation factor)
MKKRKKGPKGKVGGAALAHVKKHHPYLYRALRNPTPKHRLGANVTAYRLKKGLTPEQLAFKAKIGTHILRKIEEAHPSSNPSTEVLEKLAKVLGVDILDLFRFITLAETVIR